MRRISILAFVVCALICSSAQAIHLFTFSAFGGGSIVSTDHVLNVGELPPGQISDLTLTPHSTNGTYQVGFQLGMFFTRKIPVDRVAIEYSATPGIHYVSSPIFRGARNSSLNSRILSQLLLVKVFYDMPLMHAIVPYLMGGFGLSHNSASSNTTIGGVTSQTNSSINNFAWALGLGATYYFHIRWFIFSSYQFTYLGKFQWQFDTTPGNPAGIIRAQRNYSNSFRLGIGFMI